MRKVFEKWFAGFTVFLTVTIIATSLVACKRGTTPATSTTAAPAALTVVNGSQTKTFTVAELKSMAAVSGWAGQMSSTGNITGPNQYKGVSMMDLLKTVGGVTETNAIRVSAKDGYTMTISYKQLTEGNFTVIDSINGKETKAAKQPVVFLAYEMNGAPIDDTVGPLRLGIMTAEQQVTEGHWWVKWAQKIEVIATEAPWTLHLQGAVTEDVDPASFESCAAIGCHGQKWTDDQGRVWEGVPLYYFVGKVDDVTATHNKDAYNVALAEQDAYEVHIVATDGTVQKLTSKEVEKNDNMIVSFRRDGAPLPTNQWPLRLVGSAVDKSRQIGQITTIKLMFGAATTTTTTPTTPATTGSGEVALTVVSGSTTKTYTLAQLQAMPPTTGYGSTKNKAGVISGPDKYTGVSLTSLIDTVGGMTDTQSVKITAKDAFSKTFTYKQVYLGGDFNIFDEAGNPAVAAIKPYVLLAYSKNGSPLDATVGPVQTVIIAAYDQVTENSLWVKLTVKIEIISP